MTRPWKAIQKILSRVRAAVQEYQMIETGDKIAVGVSGGKDSLVLLCALHELIRFYPKSFAITALTVDPCFSGEADFSPLQAFCDELAVPLVIRRTNLNEVVFKSREEKNPCSLCAKMRRGILHDMAVEVGCNKIALGHHLDDAAETFYMNLFRGGRMECFSPVSYLSRKNLTLIRPMILTQEKEITKAANKLSLPVMRASCPVDGHTERQKMKVLLKTLEQDYEVLNVKTVDAMRKAGISRW